MTELFTKVCHAHCAANSFTSYSPRKVTEHLMPPFRRVRVMGVPQGAHFDHSRKFHKIL